MIENDGLKNPFGLLGEVAWNFPTFPVFLQEDRNAQHSVFNGKVDPGKNLIVNLPAVFFFQFMFWVHSNPIAVLQT